MKKLTFRKISVIGSFLLGVILISCSENGTRIDYKTAEGYFVLNTIKNEGAYEKKFTTQESFDKYFGKAAVMGKFPTAIDFDKEFAIAYIAPETQVETQIEVDSVIWNGKKVEMWLSIQTGDSMSYTIRPVKLLLIDKNYNGNVTSFVTGYESMTD